MNESENQFEPVGEAGIEELRNELQSLRASFSTVLVLMFVFGFCVDVFLFHQARVMSGQANQAKMIVDAWAPGGAAQIQAADFWNKLVEFSKTHPDFVPIINKYGQYISSPRGATPPAAPKK